MEHVCSGKKHYKPRITALGDEAHILLARRNSPIYFYSLHLPNVFFGTLTKLDSFLYVLVVSPKITSKKPLVNRHLAILADVPLHVISGDDKTFENVFTHYTVALANINLTYVTDDILMFLNNV